MRSILGGSVWGDGGVLLGCSPSVCGVLLGCSPSVCSGGGVLLGCSTSVCGSGGVLFDRYSSVSLSYCLLKISILLWRVGFRISCLRSIGLFDVMVDDGEI